ncbi:MAG: TetR/AcrR family transcriptional regulator [Alphaproteobacteria bacterium]
MKAWTPDHPKAKLMARNRGAIVRAAREAFLQLGYERASMEKIAAAANVSIMTLYRHAESKDDLFTAVITNACDPDDEGERAEFERMLREPLGEILTTLGIAAQQKLADPQTAALMRTVVAEATRFPDLAEKAYRGYVGHLEDMIEEVLAQKAEGVGKATRRKLSAVFIDRLFGADMLRILLGLQGVSEQQHCQRAERARDEVLAGLEASLSAVSA